MRKKIRQKCQLQRKVGRFLVVCYSAIRCPHVPWGHGHCPQQIKWKKTTIQVEWKLMGLLLSLWVCLYYTHCWRAMMIFWMMTIAEGSYYYFHSGGKTTKLKLLRKTSLRILFKQSHIEPHLLISVVSVQRSSLGIDNRGQVIDGYLSELMIWFSHTEGQIAFTHQSRTWL